MENEIGKVISSTSTPEEMGNDTLYERFLFNSRNQSDGESLQKFVENLQQLVQKCNFADHIDQVILDRLICGVKDKRIQSHILQEAQKGIKRLTLEKALELAEVKTTQLSKNGGSNDLGNALQVNIKSENSGVHDVLLQSTHDSSLQGNESQEISNVQESIAMNGVNKIESLDDDEDEEMDDDDFSDTEEGSQNDDLKGDKENSPPKDNLKFSSKELFATKCASMRANRKEIECEACDYKCLT